jgi:hypothetical protein
MDNYKNQSHAFSQLDDLKHLKKLSIINRKDHLAKNKFLVFAFIEITKNLLSSSKDSLQDNKTIRFIKSNLPIFSLLISPSVSYKRKKETLIVNEKLVSCLLNIGIEGLDYLKTKEKIQFLF